MDGVSRPGAEAQFGEALRRLRTEAGLSQEELAERAGLSVRGLRYLERGLRHPYRSTVLRLSEALHLNEKASAELSARRVGASASRPGSGAHHPPTRSGPLIGREREVDHALRLLRDGQVRLLTVTGLGGVGKTRFALELAARLDRAGATVVWVPLAALTDAASVPRAVAQAVGVVSADSSQLIDVLANALEEQVLLLDNAEQVAASASFIADLAERCPTLTVIVTSRVALGLHLEQRFPLLPLTTPDPARGTDPHALAVNPAVDLFLRRLQAVDPHYVLTAANAASVAAVVTRLEGLPLALELAAARSAALPPEALAARLDSGLELLASDAPDLPRRHRTMRATIAWSYDLLPRDTRGVFRQLAVFEDGAALTSIEALPWLRGHRKSISGQDQSGQSAPDAGGAQSDSLAHLDALLTNSLLRTDGSGPGAPRYRMHELVRSYGVERLIREGDEERVRSWHAEHFLRLADQAERHFFGPDSAAWLDRLEAEHANLRAALRWFRHHDPHDKGLQLAGALSWFWYVRGHAVEGRTWLDTLLLATSPATAGASTDARRAALRGAGQLAQTQGDYHAARTYLEEAITLSRTVHAHRDLAASLLACGFVARIQEDYASSVAMLEEAAAIAGVTGPEFVVAATQHHLGMIAADAHHDLTAARCHFQASLRLYRRLGMTRFEALVLLSLADLAYAGGNLGEAGDLARNSLALMRTIGEQLALHGVLDTLAAVAIAQGDAPRGVRLAGAAAHLRELCGLQSWPVVERRLEERLATVRASLTSDEYQDRWDDGHSMPESAALAFALGEE